MRLQIVTPLVIVVDEEITKLRAEDASGSFGILPGHAFFLTALAISVVSWHTHSAERHCAVRGGVLIVTDNNFITIAAPEAFPSDDLALLDSEVLSRYLSNEDAERVHRATAVQLQLNAIRRLVSTMGNGPGSSMAGSRRTGADAGEFR